MPGEKQQISVSFNTGRWRFRGGSTKGGTGFGGPQRGGSSTEVTTDAPELTNAELVQLRVRVIALENLAIALLRRRVRSAVGPRPRDGGLHFPEARCHATFLAVHAAAKIIDLAQRAGQFRAPPP